MPNKTDTRLSEGKHKRVVGKRTAHVASFMVIGRFASLIISGIAFIIIARLLGPSTYGIYALAAAYAGLVVSVGIADIGVSTAFPKFIGQYSGKGEKAEIEKVLSNGYMSVIISGAIITLIAFSLSGLLAGRILGSSGLGYILEIASFAIFFALLSGISYTALVGFGKGSYLAMVVILQSAVQAAVSIVLAVTGFGAISPIIGILAGNTCTTITAISIFYTKFGIRFRRPSLKYMKRLLTFSYPIAIYNSLSSSMSSLSPIVLGLFTTTAIVGNFAIALKTGNIITDITTALGAAVLPMFAYAVYTKELNKHTGKFYNYVIYFTYLLITPALFYIALLSRQFSYTVFSGKYLLAPTYLSIISIGLFIWIVSTYTTMLLIGSNRVRTILKYGLAITAIELALILTVVPHFGGTGLAVILYIITPTITGLLMVRAVKNLFGIRLEVMRLAGVLAAGMISAAFLLPMIFFVHNYILILVLGAVEQLIIYPIIVALVGAVGKEELKVLKDATEGIPVMNLIIRALADYSGYFVRG